MTLSEASYWTVRRRRLRIAQGASNECDDQPLPTPPAEEDWVRDVRRGMASSPVPARRGGGRMQVTHQQNAQDESSDSDNSAETASRSRNNSSASSDDDQLQDSNLNSSSHDSDSMSSFEWPQEEGDGDDGDPMDDTDTNASEETANTLCDDLAKWATVFRVSQSAVTALLKTLKRHDVEGLPASARTLLKTPRDIEVQQLTGGQYYHFGIEASIDYALLQCDVNLEAGGVLQLQINIDGLPINNSNNDHLWPILGIVEYKDYRSNPFCIGTFYSTNSKAGVVQEFLHDFIQEYLHVHRVGLTVRGVCMNINLSAIICDAPAMAFVKEIKLHSGYGACFKCEERGVKTGGRMTFGYLLSRLRTDDRFRRKVDTDHHKPGVTSPFVQIEDLDMIEQFLYDYMHLVLLCVMKRLMKCWVYGPGEFKLDQPLVNVISTRLLLYAKTCPSEFGRQPRSLANLRHFKATEFRSFLCYTGVCAIMGVFNNSDVYYNFLLLMCAMRILLNPVLSQRFHAFAEKLLVAFVKHYKELYGEGVTVFSVHGLIHLPRQAAQYGHLDRVSSFPYESYLYRLKQLIRKPGSTLKQVVARLFEERHLQVPVYRPKSAGNKCMLEHVDGPLPQEWRRRARKQFKAVIHAGVKFSTSKRDSGVIVSGKSVGKIQNLLQDARGDVFAVLRLFSSHENQFTEPLPSRCVGIHRCSSLQEKMSVRPIAACSKVWLLPAKNQYCLAVEVNNDMGF